MFGLPSEWSDLSGENAEHHLETAGDHYHLPVVARRNRSSGTMMSAAETGEPGWGKRPDEGVEDR
jgi:hypothetical protein